MQNSWVYWKRRVGVVLYNGEVPLLDLVNFEYVIVLGGGTTSPEEGRVLIACRLLIGGTCGDAQGCSIGTVDDLRYD